MRSIPAVAFLTVVLFAGCRPRSPSEVSAAADARRACMTQPLVLMPWATEGTLVEENEYRHLVKEISDEIALGLRDRLGKLGKFERVVLAPDCPSGVRLESRVVSLIHKRRRYHYKIAGRVLECGTERVLHTFEIEEENKEVGSIANRLADNIADEFDDDVACSTSAVEAGAPPPEPLPAPPPPSAI